MVQRVTTNDNERTTNENEWQRVVQRARTSGTMSDSNWYNKRQRVVQRMTASGVTNIQQRLFENIMSNGTFPETVTRGVL